MNYRKPRVKSVQLETWTSPEVKNYVNKNGLAIIPLGSFEQHGPHAPLGTDTFISLEVSNRLAKRLDSVVLPPIWYGISDEHMDFAGTITVSPETLTNLIVDIVVSLMASGFAKFLIINGHAGNIQYFDLIKEKLYKKASRKTELLIVSYWDKLPDNERNRLSSLEWGLHANEFETSIISAIFPGMVKKLRDIRNFPDLSVIDNQEINEKVFRRLIKDSNGVWGDPEQASVKKGRALLATIELTLSNYLIHALKIKNPKVKRNVSN